ncbi:helix-turn-helix domain-containing protein [Methylobacterium sp. E-005]|uniref:helix-turn-helix domain-containing protein n=1 Tax=Methylobacterium sp. E-005 TaxID=2836549 RepID=UPI001FBA7CFF|nr:helix-turn-helix domain-containing protein [Methylobacterium sp. E-005]MCJ2084711.1 helix-turn-helix domain-containing protein [Methylobacterium sp. E-005]
MNRIACLRFEPPQDPQALGRAWQDHLAPIFAVSFRPETDLTIPIAMRSYHLGDLLVGDVMAPAHILVRSPEMIRQQGLDHLLLQFYRRGQSLVEAGPRTGPVTEVQAIVFDLGQPVRIVADPVDATNVLIPRAVLEQQGCHPDALHGRALDHDGDPFGRLVHSFVANVVACGDLLDRREALAASAAITQLCATWLRGKETGRASPNPDARIRIRRLVEAELGNPKLTPALIAARLGLSRSTLYRLFAPHGIVAYIRDRRLMAAMRMLVRDDGPQAARVAQVAYAVGFSDERTFRRAFKRRFGFVPSTAPRRPEAELERAPGAVLRDWIESL